MLRKVWRDKAFSNASGRVVGGAVEENDDDIDVDDDVEVVVEEN